MTAQPHMPAQPYVPEMTIRGVRDALPPEDRAAFVEKILETEPGQIEDVLRGGHLRAVLYAEGSADAAFAAYRSEGVPADAVAWSAR